MSKDTLKAVLAMLAGILLGCVVGYVFADIATKDAVRQKHNITMDTITYIDTVAYCQPTAKDSVVVRYVTRLLPIVRRDTVTAYRTDTLFAEGWTNNKGEGMPPQEMSVDRDSIAVAVPITQKRYEGDEYKAWVSGYQPSLDSILVFPRTTLVRETTGKPPDRWHIGITGGYGYGFRSRQAEPYVGIGITYSIISF